MWQLRNFNCQAYNDRNFLIINPMAIENFQSLIVWQLKKNQSPHDWRQSVFDCQACDDQKVFVTTRMATESIPLPIVWWPNFFQLSHVFGCRLFDWQWIDFHHWFGDKIWSCLVIKCKPCMSIFIFSFGVCGPCVV